MKAKKTTMTMKTLPKRLILAATLAAIALQPAQAGGIPVIDGAAISQSIMNSVKELRRWQNNWKKPEISWWS